jgi:5'-methylthioadenosine phosphorylase
MSGARKTIALIGGSGMHRLFQDTPTKSHHVGTPWGPPSGPIEEGIIGGVRTLFLARHGPSHTIPPHRVNYRANVDALQSLGAEAIITVSSVGSLKEELAPGSFVLPDQFIDLTKGRPTTFFDGGRVVHVSLADPFCPDLTAHATLAGDDAGFPFRVGGTYVCIEGPRFSTRAESRYFRTFADLIGMTLVPEVSLARERGMCYLCLAAVTDYDAWSDRAVNAQEIVETMRKSSERMRRVLETLIPRAATEHRCACERALEEATI